MKSAPAVLAACAVLVVPACRGKSPEQRAAEAIERLRSPDSEVSGPAGRELIDIGEPAVPALAALLGDPEPRIRRASATTLWGLGTRKAAAVPTLAETLRDADPEVRLAAVMALESAGEHAAPAVAALTAALKDSDANVRLWAAKALGSVGPAARPAVPALVEAARADFLRGAAEEALRRIQGPGTAR